MFSNRIAKLNPYIPGEQPTDKNYIKLNANENPYPPSQKVQNAILHFANEDCAHLSLYPDPDSLELRKAIANHLNYTKGCMNTAYKTNLPTEINENMIHVGNGSDEVLSFIFYTFFDSDKNLAMPNYTYSFYPVYCGFYDISFEEVALNKDFSLDTDSLLESAKRNSNGLIFANPNAPTALSISVQQVRQMLKNYPSNKVFVIDEAYVDFANESCISLLNEFKNLVIVRTFSKSMCAAGTRLGYCVANEELIDKIKIVKNSFNHFPVDKIAQLVGIASCDDTDYYIAKTHKIVATRERFIDFLRENDWFVTNSATNFVFTKKDGFPGEEIYQIIKKSGILVRHFSAKGIDDYVRITIGTDEQMESLMRSIKSIN